MSRHTGSSIDLLAHLRQSVSDILTTPIGSRVMMRDYGSRLYALIDRPMTPALKVDVFAACVDALSRWEPRLIVDRVFVQADRGGQLQVGIEARTQLGEPIRIDGVTV
ncbi:GPW/gp25 family protein [Algimonas porphyrae]|nr:GPW/gp25 family protein [Algimonas porphyrae]